MTLDEWIAETEAEHARTGIWCVLTKEGKHMKNLLTDAEIAAEAVIDGARGHADAQEYLGLNYTHGWDGFPYDPNTGPALVPARRGAGATQRAVQSRVAPRCRRRGRPRPRTGRTPVRAGRGGGARRGDRGDGIAGSASTADVVPTMSRIVGVTAHRN